MAEPAYEFDGTLHVWAARPPEQHVDLPEALSDEIAEVAAGVTRGFGSVRVEATIGSSTWRTSLFPGASAYVLPVKKPVRVKEGFDEGDRVHVSIVLVDLTGDEG
ncbi:DUF1905 domain-containing protein [Cellulomonas sp. JH27-2]|uniref:DUF1905 domain-containing protein n=1 Tax=Cellulomonas sp. JH27-2 TaxID=2774139 RepID=UPI001783E585|nr:DUF1905 domain-containing protein [Cellulomonas sp. JH27-2]